MTGAVDDERIRVWLFNLYRYACDDDCKRTLAQYMGRVKLITKAMKYQVGRVEGRGLVEIFAETDLFHNVDNFWSEFQNLIEGRGLAGVLISATLEGACAALRDGNLVNTGYLLEHPNHVIYWHMIRDKDWHHLFKVYWDFESEHLVPTPAHVVYLVNRVLQAAQDLTLAIRLKNDLIINDGKGPEAMINEIDVAKLIVNRFFHGHDIAPEEDVPVWAAVHCLTYYCAAQSIASRILHNRDMQIASGMPHISDADAAALKGTADRCAKGLPALEAIKENGWNVFLAESVDPKGVYANHRESRLTCLREWATWVNNPYDEQRGASGMPEDRRGKRYTFDDQGRDEFPTPPRARWPQWTIPGYLNYYDQKYGVNVNTATAPQKVEPMSATGTSGTPNVQQAFAAASQGASAAAPSVPPWRDPTQYTVENDPWFIKITTGVPYKEEEEDRKEDIPPKIQQIARDAIPPMAYDPATESAGEEDININEDWIFPPVQDGLRYERYRRTAKPSTRGAGYIKLLAQPSFSLKPMIEEAVVPSTSTMSTYSCYLRKVTSYVACWSGCIPLKVLRRYRKRDDVEWIKLYNYCMSEATLRNTHLFLKARDFAALCGILPSSDKLQAAVKKLTSQRFLNNVASSTSDSTEASSGVRLANTGLFTDFEIVKTSNTRNKINIQSALGDQFAWANIHHVSVEEKNPKFECRCLEVIAKASEYVESLSKRGDDAKAGTSIHIWFSFAEYVQWSKNGVNSTFFIDDERVKSIAKALSGLVCNSFAPIFVSLCSCSDFFHGDEMQLGKIMRRIASELTKLGAPVTHNPAMWSEIANFIDYRRVTINPTSIDTTTNVGEPWDSSAAFACIDKFLFREKMLFACVVGDDTISSFESNLDEFPLDGVLTQLPTELTLTEAAANCERISTDALRKSKTVNPLTNVDFDAINPKVMYKEDRFWYRVPVRSSPIVEGFFQDDPQRMVMCSRCSTSKGTSNEFDVFAEAAKFCPNCASNFCRKFYFNESAPDRAEIVLRWAASIIIHEKELSQSWGILDPANNIRTWIFETIRTFRTHQSGVGKFVSHFGTTRMNARSAANAMAQGQGKQLTVERHQVTDAEGQTQEYYQFSYDHGNRMYSDYMKKLFSTPEIYQLIGCDEPTEEVLGDCIEVCLGILRVAIMYEGHGPGIFKWKDVNGTLTGLEHSLMMYNASAYPSGLKNRKSNPSKSKGKAYTFDDCQDVPITSVPKRKSPVIMNEEYPEIADALMSDATLVTKLTEGKTLGTASLSTEANRNEPVAAPGMDAAKRRKVIPQTQMQDIFGGMLNFIEQAISTDSGCLNCLSNEHKVEQCPHEGAVEWMNLLIGSRWNQC